ncbi:hypothetical protein MEO41_28505, partial [Dolichospermum sp. ST_sed4]|nr:hypothetical protein [Dolichospermum sp. ST_sed4]
LTNDSENTTLSDNIIYNNDLGILVNSSSIGNILYNSNISNNYTFGVDVKSSSKLHWIINKSGYATNNPINLGNGNITVTSGGPINSTISISAINPGYGGCANGNGLGLAQTFKPPSSGYIENVTVN